MYLRKFSPVVEELMSEDNPMKGKTILLPKAKRLL
jgi:hypothetical protein